MGIDAVGLVTFVSGNAVAEINEDIDKSFREDECFKLSLDGTIDFGVERYYSDHYARGNAMKIITTLEFLRRHPRVDSVFYNGDIVEEYQLWTEERRDEYLNEWFSFGHKRYWRE